MRHEFVQSMASGMKVELYKMILRTSNKVITPACPWWHLLSFKKGFLQRDRKTKLLTQAVHSLSLFFSKTHQTNAPPQSIAERVKLVFRPEQPSTSSFVCSYYSMFFIIKLRQRKKLINYLFHEFTANRWLPAAWRDFLMIHNIKMDP